MAFKEVYQKLKFKEKLSEKKQQISQLMAKIDRLTAELDQAKVQQKTKDKNHLLEMRNLEDNLDGKERQIGELKVEQKCVICKEAKVSFKL